MALVGLFFIFVFLLPSVSLAIEGDPDDRLPTPPSIPLDPRVDLPPSGLPAAPDPAAPGAPVAPGDPVVVENPTVVTDTNFVWLRKALHEFVVTTFGVLLSGFGNFFDYAVDNFVIGFGDKYINSGTGFVIDELWGIIRNIFNLTLIFGLVYIGFQMILGLNNSAQRSIGYLVAAALLVNFSLFITKFVVDFSNQAATQIYQAMVPKDGGTITTTFTNAMSLSGIMSVPGGNYGTIPLGYIFGILLIFVVTAFVFAAGGIMLLLRYIGLNLYLVFSPLLFLGWVFPSMSGYSKKYWSGFLGKAFFAPAFIFMLYLSIRVINGYGTITGTNPAEIFNFNPGAQPGITSLGTFSFFIMVIGFLLASLVVAQKMGATGATASIAVGQRLRKGAQGIVTGLGARATRGSIDRMATSNNVVARAVGIGLTKYTGVRDAADKAYKSSPQGKWKENRKTRDHALATRTSDARTQQDISTNAVAGGPALESAVRTANQTQLIEALRKHKVGSLGYNHIVGAMTQSQITKLSEAKDDEFSPKERSAVSTTVTGKIVTRITDPATSMIDTTKVPSLTFDELETLGDSWLTNPTNLKLLTNSQVEKLAKDSKVLGTSQKATFKNDWKTALRGVGVISPTTVENAMRGRGPKEIVKLPNELLMDMSAIPYLSESVLKEIAEEKMPQAVLNTIERNMGYPGAEPTGKDYLIRPINKHRDRFW